MGTVWEDLGKKVGETAEAVTNKAGEIIEIQKLKNQIRSLERGNENDFADLGRMVYEQFKKGEAVSAEAEGLCEAIQSREESIADYEKQIADVKGDFDCGSCGKKVAKGMTYCPYCGEKTPEEFAEKGAEYVDELKEKVADAAEKAADKAEDIAEKAGGMVEKAADKAEDIAEKAGEAVEKAADKVEDIAGKVADKMKEKSEDGEA